MTEPLRRRVRLPALGKAGVHPVQFHDLRHTGNTQFSGRGEPARADGTHGHSSTRAGLIYLHSTGERQREIADALGVSGQHSVSQTIPEPSAPQRKNVGRQM